MLIKKISFMNVSLTLLLICLASWAHGQSSGLKTENVFIITSDGLRWHEVFLGAELPIIQDHVENRDAVKQEYWREEIDARRKVLMPFFWNVIAEKGQLHGNRDKGSKVNVTNSSWGSYPGYNEILTGFYDDDRVITNHPIVNPNYTILDFLNDQDELHGSVGVVASWWQFHINVNAERSGIKVVAGPQGSQPVIMPQPDTLTHDNVLKFLSEDTPRVAMLVYDDTDNRAHEGGYEAYLKAARNFDEQVKELWEFTQSHPQYKDRTTFLISTDHGRGIGDRWPNHGSGAAHSNEIWMAVIGPDTPALGEATSGQYHLNQIASTAAAFLGYEYVNERKAGDVMTGMFKSPPVLKKAVQGPVSFSFELTDAKRNAVVSAHAEVVDIQRRHQRATPWIPTAERARVAHENMQAEANEAIQEKGLTLEEYEVVVQALRYDPVLRDKFFTQLKKIRDENK